MKRLLAVCLCLAAASCGLDTSVSYADLKIARFAITPAAAPARMHLFVTAHPFDLFFGRITSSAHASFDYQDQFEDLSLIDIAWKTDGHDPEEFWLVAGLDLEGAGSGVLGGSDPFMPPLKISLRPGSETQIGVLRWDLSAGQSFTYSDASSADSLFFTASVTYEIPFPLTDSHPVAFILYDGSDSGTASPLFRYNMYDIQVCRGIACVLNPMTGVYPLAFYESTPGAPVLSPGDYASTDAPAALILYPVGEIFALKISSLIP